MKIVLFLIFTTFFVIPADAKENAEQLFAAVSKHCSTTKPCACFGSNLHGLSMTFGNGQTALEIFPDYTFQVSHGTVKSQKEVEKDFETFFQQFNISALQPYCVKFSAPGPGINGFIQSLRYYFLEELFQQQLIVNGGFCNPFQKCVCEFDMGGIEMEPDFKNKFAIDVSGEQFYIYTSGSAAGPIQGENFTRIEVNNLGAILHKSKEIQDSFIEQALAKLEQYRPVCRDFAPVIDGGRKRLHRLILNLEQESH